MFLRMKCLKDTGLMDEGFYMHMEEIDLCWRFHLVGYKAISVPESVVFHYGGWSLNARAFRKAYLNHGNQLVMQAVCGSQPEELRITVMSVGSVMAPVESSIELMIDTHTPIHLLQGGCHFS